MQPTKMTSWSCQFCLSVCALPPVFRVAQLPGGQPVSSIITVFNGESQVPTEWLRASRASTGRSFLSSLDVPFRQGPNEKTARFQGMMLDKKTLPSLKFVPEN